MTLLVSDPAHRKAFYAAKAAWEKVHGPMPNVAVDEFSFLRSNPNHDPRTGQFASGGGGVAIGGGTAVVDDPTKELVVDFVVPKKVPFEIARTTAKQTALKLGVDQDIINVVDKEPRAFTVGTTQFNEGGHYNPETGQIEINVRGFSSEEQVEGITAHETSHALYDAAVKALTREHQDIQEKYFFQGNDNEAEFKRLFHPGSGYPREEALPELMERYPVSALFHKTIGDGILTEKSMHDAIVKANGHSAYSKAYWTPEAQQGTGAWSRAINETTAEAMRYRAAPDSWVGPKPQQRWLRLAIGLVQLRKHGKI